MSLSEDVVPDSSGPDYYTYCEIRLSPIYFCFSSKVSKMSLESPLGSHVMSQHQEKNERGAKLYFEKLFIEQRAGKL